MLIDYFNRVASYGWWRNGIEFIIIGIFVYCAVNFLEGTRGERLFRGVIYLSISGAIILNLVAERFGFERLEYLYKGFLIAVLVIAVAAFQPEVRRALIRIGQPNFLARQSQELAKTVEEIIHAIMNLATTRTGAIIVIENRVALGELIETGVRLDATLTSELLRTIFNPNTALHDMAVLVRGEKIIAARVQLPLAEAGSLDGVELGSRHRAAIGISSTSDAGVLIVSEETGIVSIAEGGKLTRNITESQLRKYLNAVMEEMVSPVEKFWKFTGMTRNKKSKKQA